MLNETTKIPAVQKAVTVIRQLSADEKIREEARKREDALFNEQSALSAHYKKGISDEREKLIQALRSMGVSEETIAEAVKRSQDD